MVVKVYGNIFSPYVQLVVIALREAKVQYELVPVEDQKSPEYLSKQPFGQVPLLEDEDGFLIYESRAIARYIISKYAPKSALIPKGLKENALFEQAVSIETSNFSPNAYNLVRESFSATITGVPPNEERLTELRKTFSDKLKGYDAILGKQKYLAGNEITLADLFHLPMGALSFERIGFKGVYEYPNVKRWWEEITSIPVWKEIWVEATVAFEEFSKKRSAKS
ncbi:glutathione S-transferase [Pyrrhoderma noxium]|uniref:glutathione transferase n=1 Tax=Pyrrhoderma noxium TaxID=2282107 RepID=A0A286U5Y9_9AGAM|nr:glutathione S-transferase [Pyrrhoderma noxium]